MVVIVAVIVLLLPSAWTDRFRADSLTEHGEQKTITLADGSSITLNSDSAIRFVSQSNGRGVALLHGEAWFDVRHDATHPFYVLSGNGRITDVGTRFDVKYLNHAAIVGVEDGIVDVSVNASSRQDRVRLTAGQGVSYGPNGLGGAQDIEPSDISSWRNGTVIFRQQPLSTVIAELNRYERSHLLLATLSNRDRPVSATFTVGHNSTALPALQEAFGLRVFRLTPWVTVLY
ncbi:FecR domain-containing protein [Acetobacter orientalis]|nr:FecR domain-containing protein [Acetobacter orientalis]MCP1216904.1 FecR domain-containing protein [Acetobacter orientalis]MCP1219749.1 FecR domain-containing protein [Acetobacter orientalis]